jgi:hypothetical protein
MTSSKPSTFISIGKLFVVDKEAGRGNDGDDDETTVVVVF